MNTYPVAVLYSVHDNSNHSEVTVFKVLANNRDQALTIGRKIAQDTLEKNSKLLKDIQFIRTGTADNLTIDSSVSVKSTHL